MADTTRLLSNAFTQTPKNELEQRLEAQSKPGHIPPPDMLNFALANIAKLPRTDARKQLLIRRQVNQEDLSQEDLAVLFGGQPL